VRSRRFIWPLSSNLLSSKHISDWLFIQAAHPSTEARHNLPVNVSQMVCHPFIVNRQYRLFPNTAQANILQAWPFVPVGVFVLPSVLLWSYFFLDSTSRYYQGLNATIVTLIRVFNGTGSVVSESVRVRLGSMLLFTLAQGC